MKVAIINSVFEYGSTGNLAKELYEYGTNIGNEVYAFYGRGIKHSNPRIIRIETKLEVYIHKIMTLLFGKQGSFSILATRRLIKHLKQNEIDNVVLLNIHGYYLNEKMLLSYLKKGKINTLYITPDEYAGMGKCCYSNDCDKYINGCNNCPQIQEYPKSVFFDQSRKIYQMKQDAYNNFNTISFAGPMYNLTKFKKSGLLKDKKLNELDWGIDVETIYFPQFDEEIFEKYHIPKDKILILTVAKYSDTRKGVKEYFFEAAKKIDSQDFHFINVGYDGDVDIPKNVTAIPYVSNQNDLAKLYSISDLYVLASTLDTMPLSCLISFACGTPVCCFYTSGLRYLAPKDSEMIKYVEEVSVDSLVETVKHVQKKNKETQKLCRAYAEERYSIKKFNEKVYKLLNV